MAGLGCKTLTILTNCLIAAGKTKGVYSQLVADGAAQFERYIILTQGAKG